MPPLRPLLLSLLLLSPLLLGGCAAVQEPPDPRDPYEGFNRAMYKFNDTLDRWVMKPVAKGYQAVTPQAVDNSVTNFFSNLDDVTVLFNDLLQLKFDQALHDFFRFTWNSTVGIFGLFDVATSLDLPKHSEDFGQTLGYWGVPDGPYLYLPFFGPSSVRDGVGTVVDWESDPVTAFEERDTRYGAIALKYVDKRADLLRASRILDTAALDPYIFLRDAYLQQRQNLVYDGNPPMPDFDEMFEEDLFEEPPLDEPPLDEPPLDGTDQDEPPLETPAPELPDSTNPAEQIP